MENKLDGNAAGGILQEIFPFEMTTVLATCTGCGTTGAIGALAAYMHGMGTVLRCPSCDTMCLTCGVYVSFRLVRRHSPFPALCLPLHPQEEG